LIAAVQRDPPDARALDALVARHWRALHARCELLTLDREQAHDLAQETWVRVLRARRRLQPDGHLAAYLATIATNIWRDWHRAERRAQQLASARLASIEAPFSMHDDEPVRLADALADRRSLDLDDQAALRLDLDAALRQLAPRERAVLLARFVDGESAAEIGARYGRTEQTITAWLRRAVRQLQHLLQDHVSHHRLQHPSNRTPHHGPTHAATHAATHVAAQHTNLDTQQAAANR
jgi:RNA polymerase sigma-70 factor (ECF subfamily)